MYETSIDPWAGGVAGPCVGVVAVEKKTKWREREKTQNRRRRAPLEMYHPLSLQGGRWPSPSLPRLPVVFFL